MYPFGWRERGIGRRTRDLLILLVGVLLLLNILQFVLWRPTATRDTRFSSALITRVRSDVASAQAVATQLSRTGGSNTQHLLAEVRQYLYGVGQLNDLSQTVFGGTPLVPAEMLESAIEAVNRCETNILAAQTIDTPIGELTQLLTALSASAATLSIR